MTPRDTANVTKLAQRCAKEMTRYQHRERHDPRHCYELFRHALVHENQEAWSAIYTQYQRLVSYWLGHTADDSGALVNRVFERFWKALSPDRFAEFPSLDTLLAYLKRCAQCVAIDDARRQERKKARETILRQTENPGEQAAPSEHVLTEIVSKQLYERASRCLNDSQESLAFRASFEWGLSPTEVAGRWGDVFTSAREVSRVKERVLRRLRRDEGLLQFLGIEGDGG